MDLARAPCRRPLTARKKGSGYENAPCRAPLTARKMGSGYENGRHLEADKFNFETENHILSIKSFCFIL